MENLKIAISGASGFVGSYLTNYFSKQGSEIVQLNRNLFEDRSKSELIHLLEGCDVVINLAGMPINHRWSKKYKKLLYKSRIEVTKKIVDGINFLEIKPKVFISASAVGYYPSDGCYDEYNETSGNEFLSHLCIAWEKKSQKVNKQVRVVNTRFGIILAAKGGAFSKMVTPAKFGVGVVLGDGDQPFSWIDLEDLGRAIEYIIQHPEINGCVNCVSPTQITMTDFSKAVSSHFKVLFTVRIPKFFIKLIMGESSQFIVEGQCVKPTKILESGFKFNCNAIDEFLKSKIS